jgi:hypothetical protein
MLKHPQTKRRYDTLALQERMRHGEMGRKVMTLLMIVIFAGTGLLYL